MKALVGQNYMGGLEAVDHFIGLFSPLPTENILLRFQNRKTSKA